MTERCLLCWFSVHRPKTALLDLQFDSDASTVWSESMKKSQSGVIKVYMLLCKKNQVHSILVKPNHTDTHWSLLEWTRNRRRESGQVGNECIQKFLHFHSHTVHRGFCYSIFDAKNAVSKCTPESLLLFIKVVISIWNRRKCVPTWILGKRLTEWNPSSCPLKPIRL